MILTGSHTPLFKKHKISTRFRNINIIFFVLASAIMAAVLFIVLQNIVKTVSKDYAKLYATSTVETLNSHLNREIALMTKAAYSKDIAEWLTDEENAEKKEAALEEMSGIINVLYSDNIYIGIHKTLNELTVEKDYTADDLKAFATLDKDYYDDAWYFECIASPHDYVFNVDIDKILKRRRVWLNFKIIRDGEPLGVISTGLEFDQIAEKLFAKFDNSRVRSFIIDGNGEIQMDSFYLGDDNFLYYETNGDDTVKYYLSDKFSNPDFLTAIDLHLDSINGYFEQSDTPKLIELKSEQYNYATIASISGTNWSVITLYDTSSLFSTTTLLPLFITIPVLFIVFVLSISAMCYRLIINPLKHLSASLTYVKDGSDNFIYGLDRFDEFGELANTIHNMKERIKADDEVRRLAAIVAIADAGIIVKDINGIVQEWNVGAENILGYKSEEIIGHTTKYYAPEESHAGIDEIERCLKKGKHLAHMDVIRKHKDGRLIDCSASYTPILAENGIFDGSVAIFHDVTDKKIAEQKAQKLAAIVSMADAGFTVKDKNGIVLEWNIGAENILGYKLEDLIGQTTKYYTPKEGHLNIDEIEKRLKKGEHIAHVEVIRTHKDGRLIDCSVSYTPIFDGNGVFDGSVAVFHDITAQKLAEKKARDLAAVVFLAGAGIVIKDRDCNIVEWNIGAQSILGYKPEEIIGKNTKHYVPKDSYDEIDNIKECLMRGEHTAHVEVVRLHKDGRLINCSATYTPVFDENGCYTGSVAVFQDISYKKKIEHELKEALEKAEEASKAKSIFLANMSHEIRTPMNGVIGFAELALDENGVSDNIKDYLTKIKVSAVNLLNIINDILDVSKIEAGAVTLENIPFNLHDLFKECESVSSLKASEKGIYLHFYSEPIINRMLIGDPTKLRQIFVNLLSNAIKFTNYGMVKLTAFVVEESKNSIKLCIEVKDSGIGMTPEQIKCIFDPFVQADSNTTRKYGGTGLGLSITKSYIEMMGGKLEVESTKGIGSKFGFTLSFKTILVEEDKYRKSEVSLIPNKPMFSGEVLVCEDNNINQEVIKKHLLRIGLSTVIAENGKQGLDIIKERMQNEKLFDLIFMDIHMPVMDGLDAMKKLIEIGNITPVIALTANAMITDREKYIKLGMSDYLSKPFTAKELWACIMRHLTPVENSTSTKTANAHIRLIKEDENKAPSENNLNEYFSDMPYTGVFQQGKNGSYFGTDPKQVIVNEIINEKVGIENVANDEQFYRRIQLNFYKENYDTMQKIIKPLNENDIISAHRIAHSLKSSAGTIGAQKLSLAAGNVDAALTNEKNNCTPKLLEELEIALIEVLTLLEPVTKASEIKSEQISKSLDKEKAAIFIERLLPLLSSSDPESVEYVEEARITLSAFGKECDNLICQIEEYDFDMAFETLCHIKRSLHFQAAKHAKQV